MASKSSSERWSRAIATLDGYLSRRPHRVRTRVGALAAFAVATAAIVRIAVNAPYADFPVIGAWYGDITTLALVVPALAAVVVGAVVVDRDDHGPDFAGTRSSSSSSSTVTRVGLVAAGVFACLTAISPSAAVPASGVLVASTGLVFVPSIVDRLRAAAGDARARDAGSRSRALAAVVRSVAAAIVALALTAAVALSLGATTGLLPVGSRSPGTTATLLGLMATPFAVGASRRALLAGGVIAAGVYAAVTTAPFVAGAVVLTVGAAIDPSVVVLSLAVGGVSATILRGLSSSDRNGPSRTGFDPTTAAGRGFDVAIGGVLLLAAGVPATVPRAIAVVLGGWFLLSGGRHRLRSAVRPDDESSVPPRVTDDATGGETNAG